MDQAWIPMKDGVRLAATLYMPDGAKPGEKFPALLEYLPYRKDDGTAAGDYPKHAYFARRGYVGVRVDIRGFGASEGVPPEREYSEQEQVDGEQVQDVAGTFQSSEHAPPSRIAGPGCATGPTHHSAPTSTAPGGSAPATAMT